jgi:hypothetical protein
MIALCAIVRDEAETIAATVASAARAGCGLAVVLDTGSTDGTPEVVRRAAEEAGLPCRVHHGPFVDFSDARNRVLEMLGDGAEWALWLDAGEVIEGATLPDSLGTGPTAFQITAERAGVEFPTVRLHRTGPCGQSGARWRWHGEVHEFLYHPDRVPVPILATARVVCTDGPRDGERRLRRLREFDLPVLRRRAHEDSSDGRSWFYLGQTLEILGTAEADASESYMLRCDALSAYDARSAMVGYADERYVAALRAGRLAANLGEDPLERLLLANSLMGHRRCEALVDLAGLRLHVGDPLGCYAFARAACEVPDPTPDLLFAEPRCWRNRWRLLAESAWSAGQHAAGLTALDRCDPSDAARIRPMYLRDR